MSRRARGVRLVLLVVGGVLVGACAGAIRRPQPVDAQWAATRWPGTTREDLEAGRKAYVNRCGSCHGLYAPSTRDYAQWQAAVELMRTEEGVELDEATRAGILHYLAAVGLERGSSGP